MAPKIVAGRLRRCWCSMLSLHNHKPLHQQPDTVNPHNEPEIANYQFGMGRKPQLIAPLSNSVVGVIFHNRKNLLLEHQQRRNPISDNVYKGGITLEWGR